MDLVKTTNALNVIGFEGTLEPYMVISEKFIWDSIK